MKAGNVCDDQSPLVSPSGLPPPADQVDRQERRPSVLPALLQGKRFPVLSAVALCLYLFVFAPAGAFGATKFFDHLPFADFEPEPGSLAAQTDTWLNYWYGYFWQSPLYIEIRSVPAGEPLNAGDRGVEVWGFQQYVADAVQSSPEFSWMVTNIRGYYLPGYNNATLVGGTNNDTMVVALDYARGSLKGVKETLLGLVFGYFDTVEQDLHMRYDVRVSGVAMLNDAMGQHVLPNMAFIDAIAIPTGLAMFCWAVRSPFAVLVPLAVIVCSLTTSLGWGEVLKQHMKVNGFAPELMATVVIALSIDFSLFVVSRLREFHLDPAVRERFAPRELLWMAYTHTSHNIFVSGIAIAAAFGGLAFIDNAFVRSIALLCMIGTLMTLLAALVLIPAVLCFLYPCCFDNCLLRGCDRAFNRLRKKRTDQLQQTQQSEDGAGSDGLARHSGTRSDTGSTASMADVHYEPVGSKEDPATLRAPLAPITLADDGGGGGGDESDGASTGAGPHVRYTPEMELSFWGRAAAFCAEHPWPVLAAALLALIFPLYNVCAHFDYDDNYFTSSPYTIPDWRVYADVLGNFQRQVDTPLTLIFATVDDPSAAYSAPSVLTEQNWPLFIAAVEAVLASPLPVGGLAHIDAPCVLDGRIINYTEARFLVSATEYVAPTTAPSPAPPNGSNTTTTAAVATTAPSPFTASDVERGMRLRELLAFLANNKQLSQQFEPAPLWPTSSTVVIWLRMPGSTWGRFGSGYLDQLRPVVLDAILPARDALANGTFVGYLGANIDSWSVMRNVMRQFVLVIAITAAMLVVAILLLFRSVFFAGKMLLTMGYTVTFSFGLNIMLYHYGWFNWAWFALDHVDKYFWLIMVIGFSVCCVLSLDYDVFLIIRLLEFRKHHGFTDKQSVVHAVSRSGPVISYAAMIMMIAFGALVFVNTMMLAQFGLTLTLAVFLDAFVVRPLIVPALIAVTPTAAVWFPRRMPEPMYEDFDMLGADRARRAEAAQQTAFVDTQL